VDLGQLPFDQIRELYGGVLTPQEFNLLERVRGLRGESAKAALDTEAGLAHIRISKETALAVMPRAAATFWAQIGKRFGSLLSPETPSSVQTVLLSLAYNRGPHNEGLAPLAAPVANGEWSTVADLIGAMQQDHPLEGIRLRRAREAALVRAEVEFLANG
jgi:GH24 family phage-related lysozyme (muramidase)